MFDVRCSMFDEGRKEGRKECMKGGREGRKKRKGQGKPTKIEREQKDTHDSKRSRFVESRVQ